MEFLRTKIDVNHKDYLKLTSLQQTTASAVLSLFGRVNGAALKGKRSDRIGEIIDTIKRVQAANKLN